MEPISAGIVPVRFGDNGWEVLLIHQVNGNHWGLPKGHIDPQESEKDAAIRELYEESNLHCEAFFEIPAIYETYSFEHNGKLIDKTVVYFLAKVSGEAKKQREEIFEVMWLPFDQAIDRATYSSAKSVLKQCQNYLISLD